MIFSETIFETIESLLQHRGELAYTLLLPLVVSLAIDFGSNYPLGNALSFLMNLLSIVVHSIFAITVHRIIIMGAGSVGRYGMVTWSRRETLFALYITFGSMVTVLLEYLAPQDVIPGKVLFLIALMVIWAASRLSLIFPGIATDKAISPLLSWKLTQKHQPLMIKVTILVPVFWAVLYSLTPQIGLVTAQENENGYALLIDMIFYYSILVFEIALLSTVFKKIVQKEYA